MKTAHTNMLGIRLNDEENKLFLELAESKGIQKSSYARSILREHLIQNGLLITNPFPQIEEIETGANIT